MIKEINNKNFAEEIKSHKNVLVDFFATWCGPCKLLGPVLDKISEKASDLKMLKINVEGETSEGFENAARLNNVSSLPTVVFYKDGVEVDRFVGFMPEAEILNFIEKNQAK